VKEYYFMRQVQSHSNPNKHYEIKMDEQGFLSCNCPSWIFNQRRDRTCKHIDEIRGTDGITISPKGTLSVTTDKGFVGKSSNTGLPKICYNYPDKCDGCFFRFKCYTSRDINAVGRPSV
jgi:hypothetical protein